MSLFQEPTNPQLADDLSGPALMEELAGAPEHRHMAVCEVCPPALCPPSVPSQPRQDGSSGLSSPAGLQELTVHTCVLCPQSSRVVGFISVSVEVGSKLLRDFDLTDFDAWDRRTNQDEAAEWDSEGAQVSPPGLLLSPVKGGSDEAARSLLHIQLLVMDQEHQMR